VFTDGKTEHVVTKTTHYPPTEEALKQARAQAAHAKRCADAGDALLRCFSSPSPAGAEYIRAFREEAFSVPGDFTVSASATIQIPQRAGLLGGRDYPTMRALYAAATKKDKALRRAWLRLADYWINANSIVGCTAQADEAIAHAEELGHTSAGPWLRQATLAI